MALPKRPESVVRPQNNTPYVVAVVVMMFLAFATIVIIEVSMPQRDNMPLILIIIGFLTPTTVSLLAFLKSQETHLSVNSRLDQFMKNAEFAALAQGRAEGLKTGAEQANIRTDTLTQQQAPPAEGN